MRAALAKPKRTRRKKSDDDVKLPGEVPPELALGTIDDAMFYTADTLHRVRSGLLPVSRADQVFEGSDKIADFYLRCCYINTI
jgi:hypothetical protein